MVFNFKPTPKTWDASSKPRPSNIRSTDTSFGLGMLSEFVRLWTSRPGSVDIIFKGVSSMTIGEVLTHWNDYEVMICSEGYPQNRVWWSEIKRFVDACPVSSLDEIVLENIAHRAGSILNMGGILGFYFGSKSYRDGKDIGKESPIIEA